jgi:hypothetical protein
MLEDFPILIIGSIALVIIVVFGCYWIDLASVEADDLTGPGQDRTNYRS